MGTTYARINRFAHFDMFLSLSISSFCKRTAEILCRMFSIGVHRLISILSEMHVRFVRLQPINVSFIYFSVTSRTNEFERIVSDFFFVPALVVPRLPVGAVNIRSESIIIIIDSSSTMTDRKHERKEAKMENKIYCWIQNVCVLLLLKFFSLFLFLSFYCSLTLVFVVVFLCISFHSNTILHMR